jgi:AraC-like DNA-binding protein
LGSPSSEVEWEDAWLLGVAPQRSCKGGFMADTKVMAPVCEQKSKARHVSALNGLTALPTATGWIARAAYARCVKKGIKADTLLRKAGLTPLQIDNPELRVPVRCQIKFVELAARALSEDLLGFHLGQTAELREIGLLYYVMASSELLGDALQRCARYSIINNEGVRLSYHADRDVAIEFQYIGVVRHSDRHQIEFVMEILVRLCRQLTGHQLMPERVIFTHYRSDIHHEIKACFGCRVVFGGIVDKIILPKAVQHLPVQYADPYLNALLQRYCDEARAARMTKASALRLSIENIIAPLLPHEEIKASKISVILGMSQRTMARRLMSQGLTFSGIVHELRYDLAKRYLMEKELSISTVAWLLGYREVSAFTHAFRGWAGKTPSEARSGKNFFGMSKQARQLVLS